MKLEVPDAFSPVIPFVPEVGFIDAQIKLMFMPHENAWDVFMFKQFVLPVQHMFRDGASKVILAFDDYENVPRAKSITQVCHQTYTLCLPKLIFCFCLVGRTNQTKRISRFTPLAFGAQDQLPPFPPIPWPAAMGNRTFKAKVVELVVTRLADRLMSPELIGKILLIDWRGSNAQQWTFGEDGPTMIDVPRAPIGEADLKFRTAIMEGQSLAADAIDGDFVPIGLLTENPNVAVARLQIDGEVGVRAIEWVHIGILRDGMARLCPLQVSMQQTSFAACHQTVLLTFAEHVNSH